MNKATLFKTASIIAAGLVAAQTALAQQYPVRPVRVIVAGPPGSATDFTARLIADRLSPTLGQQFVIDNRAGAGGIIAHELAAKAVPDGYTLLFSTSAGLVINPLLTKTSYDTFRDLAPISLASVNPQMLFAAPSLPVKTVPDLIALARSKPGQLNCASAGAGTPNHLGCELLKVSAKIDFVHVPYKGATSGITDVIAGQAQFMFNSIPAVLPLVKSGKVRALGVGGPKRSPAAPDVPTIGETIPGFECVNWYAMSAPAKTPAPIVAKLNGEVVKMIADPSFAQKLIDMGSEPQSSTPAELTKYMRKESERWDRVIKSANLKLER